MKIEAEMDKQTAIKNSEYIQDTRKLLVECMSGFLELAKKETQEQETPEKYHDELRKSKYIDLYQRMSWIVNFDSDMYYEAFMKDYKATNQN